MKREVIINADDYGLSDSFNRGIVELITKGIVSSTTVMIDQKFIDPDQLKAFSRISIGLHLELPGQPSIEVIDKQIEKFNQVFDQSPSHLDGHQHCHTKNGWLKLVIKASLRPF